MYWLEVSVETDGEGAEAVAEALRPYAHNESVVMEQLGDAGDPAPDALEPAVTVKIYVAEEKDSPALRRRIEVILYHLGRLYPLPEPQFRQLEEQDWANAWKDHYRPFRIGERIWIRPSWVDPGEPDEQGHGPRPEDVILVLDPGMAFGTGSHPTTKMCLQALEELVSPGMRVLDVGTGSAILAITAARLGAAAVLAVDVDELALKSARSNVVQNHVSSVVTVRQGTLGAVDEKPWDIVVVNILAPVIIDLLDNGGLMDYVAGGGALILSGITDEQMEDVKSAVARHDGRRLVRTRVMGDWVALVVGGQEE